MRLNYINDENKIIRIAFQGAAICSRTSLAGDSFHVDAARRVIGSGNTPGFQPKGQNGQTSALKIKKKVERATGFEPATPSLGSLYSTS